MSLCDVGSLVAAGGPTCDLPGAVAQAKSAELRPLVRSHSLCPHQIPLPKIPSISYCNQLEHGYESRAIFHGNDCPNHSADRRSFRCARPKFHRDRCPCSGTGSRRWSVCLRVPPAFRSHDDEPRKRQPASGFFISPPAQSNALFATDSPGPANSSSPGSGLAGSPSFAFTAPGNAFAVFVQPNEPAFTANDLFPPLLDILGTGFPGDPRARLVPGAGGSNLDITGANRFEASIAPRWVLRQRSRYPVTVTLPAQVTVGDDPYYFGHHFGWIAVGVNVRVPLSFIPRQCGKWSATTSADLCYYGTTMAEFENSIGLQVPKVGAALTLEL